MQDTAADSPRAYEGLAGLVNEEAGWGAQATGGHVTTGEAAS